MSASALHDFLVLAVCEYVAASLLVPAAAHLVLGVVQAVVWVMFLMSTSEIACVEQVKLSLETIGVFLVLQNLGCARFVLRIQLRVHQVSLILEVLVLSVLIA